MPKIGVDRGQGWFAKVSDSRVLAIRKLIRFPKLSETGFSGSGH